MLGGCLHSGRALVSDGFCWAKMAEAALLTIGTDALAGGTVSDDVGDVERSSTDPRVLSCQLTRQKRYKFSPWARVAAQLGRLSAQPAPAPTRCGQEAKPRLQRPTAIRGTGQPCPIPRLVRGSNLLSVGREKVTVSPVYREPVTIWWCIRPVLVRLRL